MASFKVLSKRQMQRQIKNRFELLKNQCQMTSSGNDVSLLSKHSLQLDNLECSSYLPFDFKNETLKNNHLVSTENRETEIKNQTLYDNWTISSDNSDDDDGVVNNKILLKQELRQWACLNNVSVTAVSQLLKILRPHFEFLPNDYRDFMRTPRTTKTESLTNGEMFYLGIQKQLLSIIKHGFKKKVKKILLQINIDGLPIFKSSSTELYPILGLCSDLNYDSPFTIGCFSGTGKPQPIELFLKPFIEEIKQLRLNGLNVDNEHFEVDISCFICDAPARAYLKGIMGHTSRYACEKCTVVGQYRNHRMNFAKENLFPLIMDEDFERDKPYIKQRSPLMDIQIKLVTQFPIDPMHLIFLGVVKRLLLNYYIEGKTTHKLSHKQIDFMNSKISTIKKYQPAEFVRKCRTFHEIKRWKATEYRSFLLYYGTVLMNSVLKREQFEHFLLLHSAIFILSNEHFIKKYIDVAESSLRKFVFTSKNIMGEDFIVYNVHNLIHLTDDVRKYGSINEYSCFPFENYLSFLKNRIHSKKHVLQQIHRRLIEKDECTVKKINKNEKEVKFQYKYNEKYDGNGDLTSFFCKKIVYFNYVLSDTLPNNCVITTSKKVCLINRIVVTNKHPVFEANSFRYTSDLYSTPLPSSHLNIFCKSLTENKILTFEMQEILCKGFLIPHKDGFGFFPLNHCN